MSKFKLAAPAPKADSAAIAAFVNGADSRSAAESPVHERNPAPPAEPLVRVDLRLKHSVWLALKVKAAQAGLSQQKMLERLIKQLIES